MSDTARNIVSLKQQLPSTVRLVAVSKTKSAADILEAYDTGHRIFGENRVQELISKKELLPGILNGIISVIFKAIRSDILLLL
jgi:uncharacterized pyridoxal phosphate-containing UPF0001 family protein